MYVCFFIAIKFSLIDIKISLILSFSVCRQYFFLLLFLSINTKINTALKILVVIFPFSPPSSEIQFFFFFFKFFLTTFSKTPFQSSSYSFIIIIFFLIINNFVILLTFNIYLINTTITICHIFFLHHVSSVRS